MNRRHLVQQLAPMAPPCFSSRLQWLEFLVAAAEEQRADRHAGPLIFEAGQPVRFNTRLNFCADCDPAFQRQQQARGHCSPAWLELPQPAVFVDMTVHTAPGTPSRFVESFA